MLFQFVTLLFLNIKDIFTLVGKSLSYCTAVTSQFTDTVRFQRSGMIRSLPSTVKRIVTLHPLSTKSYGCRVNSNT